MEPSSNSNAVTKAASPSDLVAQMAALLNGDPTLVQALLAQIGMPQGGTRPPAAQPPPAPVASVVPQAQPPPAPVASVVPHVAQPPTHPGPSGLPPPTAPVAIVVPHVAVPPMHPDQSGAPPLAAPVAIVVAHVAQPPMQPGPHPVDIVVLTEPHAPSHPGPQPPAALVSSVIVVPPVAQPYTGQDGAATPPPPELAADLTCGICLLNYVHNEPGIEALPCAHVCHTECITRYSYFQKLPRQNACPMKCHQSTLSTDAAAALAVVNAFDAVDIEVEPDVAEVLVQLGSDDSD